MRYKLVISMIFVALWLMFYSAQAREAGQTKDQLERGRRLYMSYCASCHGVDGSGNGPVASSLKKPPPDLRRFQTKIGQFKAEDLRKKISGDRSLTVHGKSEMPVWGVILSRADINELVKYVESIQRPFEAQPTE